MKILLEKHMSGKNEPHNMAFGADKPFVMKIACAIFPPSLRFAQAGLAAQKIVRVTLRVPRTVLRITLRLFKDAARPRTSGCSGFPLR